jgi:hypothetical protein
MHLPIGIMVVATDAEEAKGSIESALSYLTGEGKHFEDYGEVLDVAKADTKEGKELIRERMEWTKNAFMDHLAQVRKMLKKSSDESLYKNDGGKHKMFRYHCFHAGEYGGPDSYLYEEWGSAIRNPKEFKEYVGDPDTDARQWWIVVVDVHC